MTRSVTKSPRVAGQCDVNIQSLPSDLRLATILQQVTLKTLKSSSTQSTHLNSGLPLVLVPIGLYLKILKVMDEGSIWPMWPTNLKRRILMDLMTSAFLNSLYNSKLCRLSQQSILIHSTKDVSKNCSLKGFSN
ncbi:hypothetical protein TNCV_3081701 [Trichonephila clavipes]|nr:hypothetical protein TNCV_3081701 [Trichonephila clavipes]